MDVPSNHIGTELRCARVRARLTQAQVGTEVGYSASAISRIESGLMSVEPSRLAKFAEVLRIPLDMLNATPPPGYAMLDTVGRPADPEEDAVRRRNLLAGALAGATALSTPQLAAAADSHTAAAGLEDALLGGLPPCTSEPTGSAVKRAVQQARTLLEAGAYNELAAQLPKQLALAEALPADSSHREGLSALYAIAARVAIKAGDDHLLIVAADRAVQAAREVGHALALAEARRMVSSGYRRSGRYDRAAQVAVRAADELSETRRLSPEARASAQGQLLATAAYTAAKGADRLSARELLSWAHSVAEQSPGGERSTGGWFGVRQVALHEVSVHRLLGAPDLAVAAAQRVDTRGMPRERVARMGLDVARAFSDWGRQEQCFRALLAVERAAPQEARRPGTRALTAGLLYGPRMPGLREFAARTGALTA
jgi:transcriptional regulator with XRE-family HTH domain